MLGTGAARMESSRPEDGRLNSRRLISIRVDATDYAAATRTIMGWAREGSSRYVCHANVHMVMEAHDDPRFAEVVNAADLVTPDGVPLVWAMRAKGVRDQTRVYGPTLMLKILAEAEATGTPVAFYGASDDTLRDLLQRLRKRYPRLVVALSRAPPFSPVNVGSAADDAALAASGARLTFVGLGCPKQERWMSSRRGVVPGVMIGVGAAFDFHAGRVRQAPALMQDLGLEWAFRLGMEPRRLFRRYAVHNPRFVALLARELLLEQSRRR